MQKISSKLRMRKELLGYLEKLESLHFQKSFEKNSFTTPETRLGIIIATSILKVQMLTEELLVSILEKKFFTSLSIIRMVFEEIILITFVLSKLKKAKSIEAAQLVLLRVSVGTASYKQKDSDVSKPYNIHTTLEEAEKYIETLDDKLKGIFEDTYSFVSEYVHPNAPSRFRFIKSYGSKKRVIIPPTTNENMKMLLNYACLTLGLFVMNIEQLLKFDFNDLRK